MIGLYAVIQVIGMIVVLMLFLGFLWWFMREYSGYRQDVNDTYDLAEIGYIRKFLSSKKDIDIDKVKLLIDAKYNDRPFRKKIQDEIFKKYFGDKN